MTATDALQRMADAAARSVNHALELPSPLKITYAKQHDLVLLYAAAIVHPLERLETAYQGIVLDATRGMDNEDLVRQASSATLGRFCFTDFQPLRLLGADRPQENAAFPPPLLTDQLRLAKTRLTKAKAELKAALPGSMDRAAEHLAAAARMLQRIREKYPGPGPLPTTLRKIDLCFAEVNQPAPRPRPLQLAGSQSKLREIHDQFEQLFQTGAIVQASHTIESFYLLRLLVSFRIACQLPISEVQKARCSSELTSLINNDCPWVTDFLHGCITDLDRDLKLLDPSGNVLFFLKGGRALAYALGAGQQGRNDWDTQVVINPGLEPGEWYELYRRVYNFLLIKLSKFKRQFTLLIEARADELAQAMTLAYTRPLPDLSPLFVVDDEDEVVLLRVPGEDVHQPEPDEETLPPHAMDHRASCKAELIDIGIPRRESIEAIEQWAMLNGRLRMVDELPIPDSTYYLHEYLLMVREGCSTEVLAAGNFERKAEKLNKRVARLFDFLTLNPQMLDGPLPGLLPRCAAMIQQLQLAGSAAASAHAALLRQFAIGYDLAEDVGLAARFDSAYEAHAANAAQVVPNLADFLNPFLNKEGWTPDKTAVLAAIGFAGYMSDRLQAHLRDKALYMAGRRTRWLAFAQMLSGQEFFARDSEFRLALSGSTAAHLHAEAVRWRRGDDLPPESRVELSILCRSDDVAPAAVWEVLAPLVQSYQLADVGLTDIAVLSDDNRALLISSPVAAAIGEFTYAPLECRITLEPPTSGFPPLASVDDTTLLPIPDLIRQYRRWAAHAMEMGMVDMLKQALSALTALLTHYDDPEPMGMTIKQLSRGQVHHLKISGLDNAVGVDANYPPIYFPDRAYTVSLTDNPIQARQRLTLPDPGPVELDRTLDLLVINQSFGAFGRFGAWRAEDLRRNITDPLLRSGVTVRNLVLDFDVSASVLPSFVTLCAGDGRIFANIYSATGVIMNTNTWRQLYPALQARNIAAIRGHLEAKMSRLSAEKTGLSNHRIAEDPAALNAYLNANPGDVPIMSIFRHLNRLVRSAYALPAPDLAAMIALVNDPWAGAPEVAMAQQLAAAPLNRMAVRNALRQRLTDILTQPGFQICLPQADMQNLPVWSADDEHDSLVKRFLDHREFLLSLARGLTRCPSTFCVYDRLSGAVTLDAQLTAVGRPAAVTACLEHILEGTSDEVAQVVALLQGTLGLIHPVVDYLQ